MAERVLRRAAPVPYRVVAVLHALLVIAQVAVAGRLLDAVSGAQAVHAGLGGSLVLVGMIQAVAAVVAWWPGRWTAWVVPASAVVLIAEIAQVAIGHGGILSVHVPLGVLVVAGQVALGWQAVRGRRRP